MKSSFKNVLHNVFGFVFPAAVVLFTTPYIVLKLTPEVYGIYVLSTSLMGLMSFMDLGFGQGIIKFVSQYEAKQDYDRINKIVGSSLIVHTLMGLVGGIIIFMFSDILAKDVFKISEAHILSASFSFKLIALGFVVNFICCVFSNIPPALQRYDVSVQIKTAVWLPSIFTTVALLYLGKGLIGILVGYIIFQFIGLAISCAASRKLIPTLQISARFDKSVFREIFGFSIFTAINGITGNIVFRVDKIIIAAFLGTEAVAYYQVPFMVVQMANGLVNSVSQSLFPAVSYLSALGHKEELKDIYDRSIRYSVIFAIIIASGLLFLGEPFISLWMGKDFSHKSAFIIPVIATVFFFWAVSAVGFFFYNGLGKAKINMISSCVGAACYLGAAFILVPLFKLMGAAIALSLTLVPLPIYFYILNRLMGANGTWLINVAGKAMFMLIVVIMLKSLITIPAEIGWFIADILLIVTFSLLLAYLLKLFSFSEFTDLLHKIRLNKL